MKDGIDFFDDAKQPIGFGDDLTKCNECNGLFSYSKYPFHDPTECIPIIKTNHAKQVAFLEKTIQDLTSRLNDQFATKPLPSLKIEDLYSLSIKRTSP